MEATKKTLLHLLVEELETLYKRNEEDFLEVIDADVKKCGDFTKDDIQSAYQTALQTELCHVDSLGRTSFWNNCKVTGGHLFHTEHDVEVGDVLGSFYPELVVSSPKEPRLWYLVVFMMAFKTVSIEWVRAWHATCPRTALTDHDATRRRMINSNMHMYFDCAAVMSDVWMTSEDLAMRREFHLALVAKSVQCTSGCGKHLLLPAVTFEFVTDLVRPNAGYVTNMSMAFEYRHDPEDADKCPLHRRPKILMAQTRMPAGGITPITIATLSPFLGAESEVLKAHPSRRWPLWRHKSLVFNSMNEKHASIDSKKVVDLAEFLETMSKASSFDTIIGMAHAHKLDTASTEKVLKLVIASINTQIELTNGFDGGVTDYEPFGKPKTGVPCKYWPSRMTPQAANGFYSLATMMIDMPDGDPWISKIQGLLETYYVELLVSVGWPILVLDLCIHLNNWNNECFRHEIKDMRFKSLMEQSKIAVKQVFGIEFEALLSRMELACPLMV